MGCVVTATWYAAVNRWDDRCNHQPGWRGAEKFTLYQAPATGQRQSFGELLTGRQGIEDKFKISKTSMSVYLIQRFVKLCGII